MILVDKKVKSKTDVDLVESMGGDENINKKKMIL
jgi:hypothetical protein